MLHKFLSKTVSITLSEGVELPTYATEGSSGADIVANSIIKAYKGCVEVGPEKLEAMKETFKREGKIKLRPHERVLFGTGVKINSMNSKFEIQVRPRSGLSLKRGLLVANSPGTVDSDYRGEIGVILYNSTPFLNVVEKGEKIAQIVLSPVHKINFDTNSSSTSTSRGEGGFGSTGK